MTVDLRGLAPALRAHAKARHLIVSDAARLAVAAALETSPMEPGAQAGDSQDAAADRSVKLTIRFRRGIAARLKTRARACGLSHETQLGKPDLKLTRELAAVVDEHVLGRTVPCNKAIENTSTTFSPFSLSPPSVANAWRVPPRTFRRNGPMARNFSTIFGLQVFGSVPSVVSKRKLRDFVHGPKSRSDEAAYVAFGNKRR
jgi:hypothetical protein